MPKYSKAYLEIYGQKTVCNCPRCRKDHTMRIKFIGRGVPRKYCPKCQIVVGCRSSGMDGTTELNKHALQRSAALSCIAILIFIVSVTISHAQTTYLAPRYGNQLSQPPRCSPYVPQPTAPIIIPSLPSGGIVLPPSYPGGMTFGFGNDGSTTIVIPITGGGYIISTD
jgi:hypothetical protein